MFLNWQTIIMTTATESGTTLFLYDPATNKDLVTGLTCGVRSGSAAVDNTFLIDGQPTTKFTQTASGLRLNFPSPINLNALSEWTIEWSSRPTAIAASYSNEMVFNFASGPLMGCRWTDGGYGERLQFNDGSWTNPTMWRPENITKTIAKTKVSRYAMVFKDGKISVYCDGIKQMLENGTNYTGGNTIQDFFPKLTTWNPLTVMYLGYYNAAYLSTVGNYGRVRISAGARYLANYTPAPF